MRPDPTPEEIEALFAVVRTWGDHRDDRTAKAAFKALDEIRAEWFRLCRELKACSCGPRCGAFHNRKGFDLICSMEEDHDGDHRDQGMQMGWSRD